MKKIRLLFLTLVALLGITSAAAKTVYLKPNSNWLQDNARFALYMFGGGEGNEWADFTLVDAANNIYQATFNDSRTNMIFARMNPGTNENSFTDGVKWNQTADLAAPTFDNELFTLGDGWDSPSYTTAYFVGFNTSIATSSHDFQVASNWSHIVGSGNYDGYGPYYMSYSYYETAGVDGTGCLSAGRQYAGDNWGGTECTDLLITPEVKGEVTLAVKKTSSSNSFIEFYTVTGTDGAWVQGESISFTGEPNQTEFTTVTLNVGSFTRIGIRASNAYIDNFTAEEANIIPEKKITIASAEPSATTGTIKWEQQANGKVLVKYTVTVTNNGEVDLTQGMDGFSVSIVNGTSGDVVVTTPVPQNLAIGETSEPFDVQAEVETTLWPNSYTYIKFNLRENLKNSLVQRAQSDYTAYEPKFVFREAGSSSSSSITAAESWGTIMLEKTKSFEIANTGTAPLTIKSVTLPDGFTSDNAPVAEFVLAKGETQALNITQDATVQGTFAGTLSIVYLDKNGVEQTYNLAFSTTVIGANTWTADFNNSSSTVVYPAGSVAEGGINKDYQYISSGNYNNWLTGRTGGSYNTENNKFITPKLHANAGDKLAFDAKAGYSGTNDYFVKVYVSTDRKTWGDPVAYYTYSTDAGKGSEGIGSAFTTKTISFDAEGDYYVAFALYGTTSSIDNLVGLEKVDVAHDLYIKSVSWPDASIKSGTAQSKPSVTFIPLTTETAENYTVKYLCGTTVLGEGTSEALTASATSSTEIAINWTPNVTETTVYPETKVVIEFTDGTKFETETFDLTVTNEPIFHFLNAKPSSKWNEPTDRTADITFGKTNTADTQSFVIFNWGSANLNVKSISLPAGFSTTTEFPLVVTAFNGENDGIDASSQALDITFSAAEAGNYSGDMVITYVNGAGEDATFQLPISGTKLDPTLFYANFDDGGWPAGSIYQGSVSSTNGGTYSAPNYYISSSSATNNLFITPKLTATAGEKLAFDAKLYSSDWSQGKVVVYAAATRDDLINFDPENDTRNKVFTASGTDATNIITTDYQTFEVPAVAGDNYYAFEISGRPYVDEIYGLTPVAVAHDWTIASSNIPAEGVQNESYTATVNIANFGTADEAADSYTVTAYVDGKAVATGSAIAIPMDHQLTATGTQLSVEFIYPYIGTFPIYLEVKSGDYSVKTEAQDVNFTGEVFTAEGIEVGTKTSTGRDFGFVDWYNNDRTETRYTDILYPAAKLSASGIKAGDKIASISFKGSNSAKSFKAEVTSWVGMSTGDITYGSPNKAEMAEVVVYSGTVDFPANVESVINLPIPIIWDGTSDIRVYTEAVGQGSGNYMSVQYAYDNTLTMDYNGTTKAGPLAYFTLVAEAPTLTGIVKNSAGAGIGGATVTLKAENGVQYSATADESGSYTMNVIQAGLDFTATVEKDGYLKNEFAYSLGGESKTLDVVMYKSFGIVGDLPGLDWNNDQVMTQSTENPNIFTLELNNVEVTAGGTYAFKLRADGQWNTYELPAAGGNYTDGKNGYDVVDGNYQWEIKTAGTYNFKFTFDWATHTLTFERPYTLSDGVQELNWVDITIDREFKAGWNALVLPFDMSAEEVKASFGESAEVAYFAGDENNGGDITVKFNKRPEGSIEAGVPYLVWSEAAVSGLKFTKDVTATQHNTTGTNFDFVGVYTTTTTSEGDYFMQGGEFKKTGNDNTVLPFRAYLKLKAPAASVRSVNVVFDEDGMPTSIDALQIDGLNGAEGAYNLSGQKVHNLQKGRLYIVNGKKVIKK